MENSIKIDPFGFREYDARWLYPKNVNLEGIESLGKGLGSQIIIHTKKNNPRVIVIQKLYGKYFNKEENLTFPKHRFKKFIKDVVNGTIERDEVIKDEITNHLNLDLDLKKLDKVFQVIVKSAIFEFLYKPKISSKIIINEYLRASNFFIEDGQTKYLNALLDKISKKIRNSNG